MSQNRYDVVFYGEILDGFEVDSVKESFTRLFSITEDMVEQIFATKRVTIKPGLDEDTANKYQQAMERVGALASIESQALIRKDETVAEEQPDDQPSEVEEEVTSGFMFKVKRYLGLV